MRLSAFAVSVAVAPAFATPLDFTINPGASSISGELTIAADTAGTLIGDYDTDTNPAGTQTRPGLFGGSGNMPVDVSVDLNLITDLDLAPGGAFSMDADTDALAFVISGLAVDLLDGETVGSRLALVFEYDTFRTFSPSFIYPGGIPLPIEVEAGSITTLVLIQSGPMTPGVLIPNNDDSYSMTGLLPVELTIVGDALGTPIEPGALPVVLPITGTFTPEPGGGGTIVLELSLDAIAQTIDTSDLPPLPDIPFPLPTLTEGVVANVILSLAVQSIGFGGEGTIVLAASAGASGCNAADLSEPFGVLDLADINAFTTAFLAQNPAADLDNNEIFDLTDIQLFVTAFVGGCL
jgi:hypothetical protein